MSSTSTADVILEIRRQRAILGRRSNAFVPAVNLPPEVLTTIFEFACCSIEDDIFTANIEKPSLDDDPDNALAGTPLLIARVCSVWRDVALNASQLWTNIIIYYEDKRDKNQAAMLKYWLSKSGERPLDVQITQQARFMETECIEVIDVLAEYGHRLRSLDLFLPAEWESAIIEIAECLPLLTHLTLRSGFEDDPYIERLDMFANAPHLREVALIGYIVERVSLPWAQLESLESRYDSVFKCVETLRLCQRLRRCKIALGGMSRTATPFAPLTHTALEELEVSFYNEKPLREFFTALELPGLRSFVLGPGGYWLFDWSSWLPSFVARVAGTLEVLTLPYIESPLEELLVALRVLPKLRKLVLHGRELTQKLLDSLNPNKYEGLECKKAEQLDSQGDEDRAEILGPDEKSNRHCVLPCLETFEFQGVAVEIAPHALVEFLLARWTGPFARSELEGQAGRQITSEPPRPSMLLATRLRSVIIKTPKRIHFDDKDAAVIKRLRLEGMHLEFQHFTNVYKCARLSGGT
ncbi:hypothetical protein BJ912DRAFT_96385 [Pholiota molesta]|nr:hypothetical protein BJ912DRAFT_96385 [Pholiota molesta]